MRRKGKERRAAPGEAASLELDALGLAHAKPLLQALHILNVDGSISADKRRKLHQVRRLLELFSPTLDRLAALGRRITVVDGNAGNAYLSLLLHDDLKRRGVPALVLAVDRSAEAVARCRARAAMLGLEGFEVRHGEMRTVELPESPDVVVALHGCDTATDEVLLRGVRLRASEIHVAPCCHAELRGCIGAEGAGTFWPTDGILAAEAAALFTDVLRTRWLAACGYEVQCVEFVPFEHTPKNRLIRASRTGRPREAAKESLRAMEASLKSLPWLLEAGRAEVLD